MAASEPLGAPYRRDAADTAALSCDEAWLHTLLLRRAEARLARDFSTADAILRQLRTMNIDVNDRTREWRADYDEHTSKRTPIGEADPKLDLRAHPVACRWPASRTDDDSWLPPHQSPDGTARSLHSSRDASRKRHAPQMARPAL